MDEKKQQSWRVVFRLGVGALTLHNVFGHRATANMDLMIMISVGYGLSEALTMSGATKLVAAVIIQSEPSVHIPSPHYLSQYSSNTPCPLPPQPPPLYTQPPIIVPAKCAHPMHHLLSLCPPPLLFNYLSLFQVVQ